MKYNLPLNQLVPEYRHKIWFIRKYFLDRIKFSLDIADLKNGEKVLDLGCGEAILLKEIQRNNKNVYYWGLDINENIKSLNLENGEFIVGDLEEKLPFDSNFFDVIFALDVLEHIKNINVVLKEISRVLKDKGKFVVCGPTESWWYKFCRFIIKGTFSSKEGPSSGEHFHSIYFILEKIDSFGAFKRKKLIHLPSFLPKSLAGVIICLYVKT
ncbi:MAG: class I SAM-dependent methyltransferase [Endomicrobia bacterium]|nr:class I SAM-dependent methyltransferase [Endomicrobiia bacterium]